MWFLEVMKLFCDSNALVFKLIDSILRSWSYLCTVPWAPGGSKFTRNPTPPEGVTIMINYLIFIVHVADNMELL